MMAKWRFYVYRLDLANGDAAYIGKGSGFRLRAQERHFGLSGHEVARFKRENDAYAFERQCIAECQPTLNRHPGGNGSRAQAAPRTPRLIAEIERVGTRRYAARVLLARAAHLIAPSKLEALRRVAHGEGF